MMSGPVTLETIDVSLIVANWCLCRALMVRHGIVPVWWSCLGLLEVLKFQFRSWGQRWCSEFEFKNVLHIILDVGLSYRPNGCTFEELLLRSIAKVVSFRVSWRIGRGPAEASSAELVGWQKQNVTTHVSAIYVARIWLSPSRWHWLVQKSALKPALSITLSDFLSIMKLHHGVKTSLSN